MNYVPRDGGNTFKGILFISGANGSMQSTNYTTKADDPVTSLEARGLRTQPGALNKVYDFNPGYGGPILKDKLWWFASRAMDPGGELRPAELSQQELRPRHDAANTVQQRRR